MEVQWTVYLVAYEVDDVTSDRGLPCQIPTGSGCFLPQPLCEVTLCTTQVCHMDELGAASGMPCGKSMSHDRGAQLLSRSLDCNQAVLRCPMALRIQVAQVVTLHFRCA